MDCVFVFMANDANTLASDLKMPGKICLFDRNFKSSREARKI